MSQPAQLERIEVDQETVAAVIEFAREHGMSPQEVVRQALDILLDTAGAHAKLRRFQDGQSSKSVPEMSGPAPLLPSNLPEGFVSRHPDRDYSWVGSANGVFGDGIEYQKSVREEW